MQSVSIAVGKLSVCPWKQSTCNRRIVDEWSAGNRYAVGEWSAYIPARCFCACTDFSLAQGRRVLSWKPESEIEQIQKSLLSSHTLRSAILHVQLHIGLVWVSIGSVRVPIGLVRLPIGLVLVSIGLFRVPIGLVWVSIGLLRISPLPHPIPALYPRGSLLPQSFPSPPVPRPLSPSQFFAFVWAAPSCSWSSPCSCSAAVPGHWLAPPISRSSHSNGSYSNSLVPALSGAKTHTRKKKTTIQSTLSKRTLSKPDTSLNRTANLVHSLPNCTCISVTELSLKRTPL